MVATSLLSFWGRLPVSLGDRFFLSGCYLLHQWFVYGDFLPSSFIANGLGAMVCIFLLEAVFLYAFGDASSVSIVVRYTVGYIGTGFSNFSRCRLYITVIW